jgi:hypothetical protein
VLQARQPRRAKHNIDVVADVEEERIDVKGITADV